MSYEKVLEHLGNSYKFIFIYLYISVCVGVGMFVYEIYLRLDVGDEWNA